GAALEAAVELLHRLRGYFWVGIYARQGEEMVRQAFRGPIPPCLAFRLGQGNVGTTGQTGRTKLIPDVRRDPTYQMCFAETRSEIVVPVRLGGEVVGVIDVESDRLDAFSPGEAALLEALAARLGTVVGKVAGAVAERPVRREG
ncbi:MAG TPA: GAF domain-containing protein, partial [Candidatus Methylomirabilis sp.]|nr:GAF domain-containing protein [Candidatus Methylomirabilis sp.]